MWKFPSFIVTSRENLEYLHLKKIKNIIIQIQGKFFFVCLFLLRGYEGRRGILDSFYLY